MTQTPFIVGIGASAGGISALSTFLRTVPAQSGMAFVVVTHLSSTRESHLHEVLATHTDMSVEVIRDGDPARADTLHVMPERATLGISEGRFQLQEIEPGQRVRKPIDIFFGALADDQGDNAAGIVMSGGDGDGTLGVKALKQRGGVTFAQADGDPPALNPEMPRSAVASGFVDFAVPLSEMAERLIRVRDGQSAMGTQRVPTEDDAEADAAEVQATISEILQVQTGHDFSGYKEKTFFRRVARRMQVCQVTTLPAYCAVLRDDRAEVDALFRDLLISVTSFFRDTEAFDALREKVIPKLLADRKGEDALRVWVPACTTGEEVFSLAILLREHLDAHPSPVRVQIFATDIDEAALSVARQGSYPKALLKHVGAERLARFFHADGPAFAVNKEVRDMCVFSPHNVIGDPPFSRMDLISCRNLLIYFGPDLQRQVIPTFHYALRPGGYLFLGTSEGVANFDHLFDAVDKKHRIFRTTETSRQWRPPGPMPRGIPAEPGASGEMPTGAQVRHRVERQVLEHHTPAHVVVREDGEIVFTSGGTGRFLEMPRGAPSRHLPDMVHRDLRLELRAALRKVVDTGEPVVRRNLAGPDGARRLDLAVEPLRGSGDRNRLFVILFSEAADAGAPHPLPPPTAGFESAEAELREMRERLQGTVEEYETALEELKSSNEELTSVNEEAQSSNEELEASKEEMQSLNEELNTINAELSAKIEELDRANSDLKNLFEATQIATVFLDADLVIRNFTPAAAELFSLRGADIGRPLPELASVRDYPELQDHIRHVFRTGEVFEHRLDRADLGAHYLVRLNPYRDKAGRIMGAVVTFVDVTSLAQSEAHGQVLIAELNHRVKNMLAVVTTIVKSSLRAAGIKGEGVATLSDRLQSMARAYSLLTDSAWTRVNVREIAQTELAAFGAERVTVSGPAIDVEPRQSLALSMVIHELATNAAKYGSLSADAGSLALQWAHEGQDLSFVWREVDGPRPKEPESSGFGFTLIRLQVEQQLSGRLETTFADDGLTVRFAFPLS